MRLYLYLTRRGVKKTRVTSKRTGDGMNLTSFETCLRQFSRCKLESPILDSRGRDEHLEACYTTMTKCIGATDAASFAHTRTTTPTTTVPVVHDHVFDGEQVPSPSANASRPLSVRPVPVTERPESGDGSVRRFDCRFITNGLRTLQLILLQNQCRKILKGSDTPENRLFCDDLDHNLDIEARNACNM